jgi:hypothetical protein
MERRLSNPEYFDLICLIYKYWDALADRLLYTGRVANMVDQRGYDTINALTRAGILNQQMKVDENWRKAIAEVSSWRPAQLSDDDTKHMVDVWHNLEFA